MIEVMLTTIDNPFDPFTDFNSWFAFDSQMGYNTCNYLASMTLDTDELTTGEEVDEITSAIEDIVRLNPLGIYRKAVKNTENDQI